MDVYVEQLVKKQSSSGTVALKVLVGIGMGILGAVSVYLMLLGFALALIVLCGVCYGGYLIITGLDCEYEYIITNGDLDVDKIIAKRKRKRLLSIKASAFEHFGKLADAQEIANGVTIVKADGVYREDTTEDFYADFTHPTLGSVRLIFSPAQKVIDGIKPYLSRNARIEFDKKYH